MVVNFSRHAKRRAKLYNIPKSIVEEILLQLELGNGKHEVITEVSGFKYPLKLVVDVNDSSITIITKNDSDNIYVTVKDSGEGMSSDEMKQIFNPFYTTKEVGKGTGLGLSVSIGIVESMGGTINVQSLKGAGSAFTVSLPINKLKGADCGR